MVHTDISKTLFFFFQSFAQWCLYKQKSIVIRDPLLSWFKSYLSDRKQHMITDFQTSTWSKLNADIPQWLALGSKRFLIYINDVAKNLEWNCVLYAVYTYLFNIKEDPVNFLICSLITNL